MTSPRVWLLLALLTAAVFTSAGDAAAQLPPPDDGPHGPPPSGHPPPPRTRIGPPGPWWLDNALVQRVGLNSDQIRQIEGLFQQNRNHLFETSSTLRKEESLLEPMLSADHPDEGRVLAQIDRIAQARSELEKTSARMLLSVRNVLTSDQWKRLQMETDRPPDNMRHGDMHR